MLFLRQGMVTYRPTFIALLFVIIATAASNVHAKSIRKPENPGREESTGQESASIVQEPVKPGSAGPGIGESDVRRATLAESFDRLRRFVVFPSVSGGDHAAEPAAAPPPELPVATLQDDGAHGRGSDVGGQVPDGMEAAGSAILRRFLEHVAPDDVRARVATALQGNRVLRRCVGVVGLRTLQRFGGQTAVRPVVLDLIVDACLSVLPPETLNLTIKRVRQ